MSRYVGTYLPCDTRQSCRLVTIETLITILTIENLNSWQSLLPDNQEWQWTAFAILAIFHYPNVLFTFVNTTPQRPCTAKCVFFLQIVTLQTFLLMWPSLVTSNWQWCHSVKAMALDLMHVACCSFHLIQLVIMHCKSYLHVNQWYSCEANVTRLPCYVTDSQR